MDHFIAGAIGSAAGTTVGYPLDLVKVRLQAQSLDPHAKEQFKGIIDCFRKTLKAEGVRGMFRGLASPVIAALPGSGLTFGTYGLLLQLMSGVKQTAECSSPLWQVFVAGSGAGVMGALVNTPSDLVKIRLQNAFSAQAAGRQSVGALPAGAPSTTLGYSWWLIKNKGIGALYQGYKACVLRDVVAVGIYFSTYQGISRLLTGSNAPAKDNPNMKPSFGVKALIPVVAGGCAGMLSWGLVQPMDVIKSRIQATPHKIGIIEATKQAYQAEGISVFGRGLGANTLRAFPMCGATFLVYEAVMSLLLKRKEDSGETRWLETQAMDSQPPPQKA